MMNVILTDDHRYIDTDTGAEYPSVTQTIYRAGLMGWLPRNDFYLERGRAVHEATELFDLGVLDEETLDPQLVPYLEAWKRYRAETGFVPDPDWIERIGVHPVHGYAGTLDRLSRDIKSGHPAPWHILQAAAYFYLPETVKEAWHAVYLHESGTYTIKIYKPQELVAAFKVFCAALAINKWKQENRV